MSSGQLGRGLIVLDRDGVINRDSDSYIKTADEWIPLPGSIEAIATLSRAGFIVAVASNQSGLARGLFDKESLEAMHDKLRRLVEAHGGRIGRIAICPHGPDDDCDCRKPKPGLLHQLAGHYGVSMQNVPFIGDSLRDLQAAVAAGASPILVRTGNGAHTAENLPPEFAGTAVFDDLAAAAAALLEQ